MGNPGKPSPGRPRRGLRPVPVRQERQTWCRSRLSDIPALETVPNASPWAIRANYHCLVAGNSPAREIRHGPRAPMALSPDLRRAVDPAAAVHLIRAEQPCKRRNLYRSKRPSSSRELSMVFEPPGRSCASEPEPADCPGGPRELVDMEVQGGISGLKPGICRGQGEWNRSNPRLHTPEPGARGGTYTRRA